MRTRCHSWLPLILASPAYERQRERSTAAVSIDQVNLDFNDALQFYYPPQTFWQRLLYRTTARLIPQLLSMQHRTCRARRLVNERIVEYAQVLRWLPDRGTILDVGCVSSRLPLHLAALGYTVHGIDVRPYPLEVTGFHFHQADVLTWEPPVQFDAITAVSTIEHFGLGRYGDSRGEALDRKLVRRLATWAKPGGSVLVTLPFGRAGETSLHRVYDTAGLAALFDGLIRLEELYYGRSDAGWRPVARETLCNADPYDLPVRGIVCLKLQRT